MIQLSLFREKVTWPHRWEQGRCAHYSTRAGRFVGKESARTALVHYRGQDLRVGFDGVRFRGEETALTEAFLGMQLANRKSMAVPNR